MGKGVMGKLTPNPMKACLVSLSSHLVYGTAMGVGFMLFESFFSSV
jgi:RsiW-degrading membrane proteinase PrsW (M82 family)